VLVVAENVYHNFHVVRRKNLLKLYWMYRSNFVLLPWVLPGIFSESDTYEYNVTKYLKSKCLEHNYKSNQQDATIQVHLLFLVSCLYFGRCFYPYQKHLTVLVFTVSGSIHPSSCRLVSWMSWKCEAVWTHPWHQPTNEYIIICGFDGVTVNMNLFRFIINRLLTRCDCLLMRLYSGNCLRIMSVERS
jgi:hypothetical protein